MPSSSLSPSTLIAVPIAALVPLAIARCLRPSSPSLAHHRCRPRHRPRRYRSPTLPPPLLLPPSLSPSPSPATLVAVAIAHVVAVPRPRRRRTCHRRPCRHRPRPLRRPPLTSPSPSPSPLPLPHSPSSSPSLPSLDRHPRHRRHRHFFSCPLRRCPHHPPCALVVRRCLPSCSCTPPDFDTPVAS